VQVGSARALTMTECSAKYKDAKAAGTLNGMTWNDFRKAKCGSDATAAPAGSPSAAPRRLLRQQPPQTRRSGVDSKYSKDSPGKARRETCLDQSGRTRPTMATAA